MKKLEVSEKFISKPNLKKMLEQLLKDTRLIAPVNVEGEVVFQEVKSVDDIVFEYENCLNTPKDYVLPNEDELFRYDTGKAKVRNIKASSPALVIFGSRPCDTKAVGLLDKFFSRKFEDPVYFRKRNNMLIVTLACGKLGRNCFCTSTRSGPYLENNFDVQLVEIDEGYFLEADSVKGKDFIKKFSRLINDAGPDRVRSKEERIDKAASGDKEFDLQNVYANLDKSKINKELWEDLGARCQSCGGCLLICPTCSCFYVIDKKIDNKTGQRVRSLDACYYEAFTRMSGGNNPVLLKPTMMKRKFYHKLWQQLDEFNEPGCTGCGRCNDICPGNVNWLKTIKRIKNDIF